MRRTWKSRQHRRDAAVAFLRKTITDPDVRSTVLKDRQLAHKIFEREGEIDLPDDVEVICVGPSTQERDRLIVFVLPPEGTDTEHLDPLKYWTGTWPAYPFRAVMAEASAEQEEACVCETVDAS
jgi:hypothetical protein